MKAYLVNLDSAEDRLAHFDRQARALGFAYQKVSAVDGRVPAFAESLGDRSAGEILGRVIAPTEVACFESHRTIWRMIVESGDSHAIVLEDDVILKPGFERYVTPGWMPPEAHVVRLESWWRAMHMDKTPAASAHGRAIHKLQSGTFGTGAYAISAEGAKDLLECTARPADPVDIVMFGTNSPVFKRLGVYQMTPAPARQAHLIADYQDQDFAKSTLALERGQSEQQDHLKARRSWWRPFPDMPDPTFTDIRNMILWTLKQRVKAALKGTRFAAVPFE